MFNEIVQLSHKQKKQFAELVQKLDYYRDRITESKRMDTQEAFLAEHLAFRRYLAEVQDVELCEIFFHSSVFDVYAEVFRDFNDHYMRSIETLQAYHIMKNTIHHIDNYESIIDSDQIKARFAAKHTELQWIDWSKGKRVGCVGCGSLPDTILYIAENTPAETVIGLDYSHEAVFIARELLSSVGIDHASMEAVKYSSYSFHDIDIVFISGYTENKSEIIERIAETAPEHVQILVENPIKGMMRLLYDDVAFSHHKRLRITKIVESNYRYAPQQIIKLEKHPM